MTIDLDELERLAKAALANTDGKWRYSVKDDGVHVPHEHVWGLRTHIGGHKNGDYHTHEMRHIAAANPETVLALVERVRALEKEREEDQGVIRVWRGRTERAEELLRDALASDLGWEDTEWGPKAAKIVGEP